MRIRRKKYSSDNSFSPNPLQSTLKPSRGWGELQAKSEVTGNSPLEFTPTQKPVQAQNYTLGEVGDVYEREADANAKQVVEHINSPETVQRNEEEGEDLQMKPQTLQRNEEEGEDLQMKPQTLQRNTAEEEDVQMKPQTLQRNEEEGEDLQMKPQTLQRNTAEEEDVQMKPLYPYIQRAILRDRPNTSEMQAKSLNPLLQRVVRRDLAEPRLGRDRNPPEMQAKPLNPLLQRVVSRDLAEPRLGRDRNNSSEIQRNTAEEEDVQTKPLQRKPLQLRIQRADGGENSLNPGFESTLDSAKRTSGQPLKPDLQAKMGKAMGADFSGVKVHTDATSDQLNQSIQAKAFTTGQDVFFKQGEYNPSSQGGQELIAHELTHVVQQGGAGQMIHRAWEKDSNSNRWNWDSSISGRQWSYHPNSKKYSFDLEEEDLTLDQYIGQKKTYDYWQSSRFAGDLKGHNVWGHIDNLNDGNPIGKSQFEYLKKWLVVNDYEAIISQAFDDNFEGTDNEEAFLQAVPDGDLPIVGRGNMSRFATQLATLDEDSGLTDTTALAEVLRTLLVLDGEKAGEEEKEMELRRTGSTELVLQKVASTCDINATVMMMGAIGIEELERIKATYAELYKYRMEHAPGGLKATEQGKNTTVETDAGSAHLFLAGEGDKLLSVWDTWSALPGNGIMKVKFNQSGAGPHTFVVERTRGQVALYQAYEGKYTLAHSLKGSKPGANNGPPVPVPRSGVLMAPDTVRDNQIDLLVNGLGTPQILISLRGGQLNESSRITSNDYKAAFGATLKESWEKRYGLAISSVSLFVYNNTGGGLLNSGQVNNQLQNQRGQITYYEDIVPEDQYANRVLTAIKDDANRDEVKKLDINELQKNKKKIGGNMFANFQFKKKVKPNVRYSDGKTVIE